MESNTQITRRRKSIAVPVVIFCILLIAAGVFAAYWYATADERLYQQGVELMDAGDYQAAIEVFESLPEHELAPARIPEAKYFIASGLMEDEQYLEAAEAFSHLDTYRDSAQQAQICYYNLATAARLAGEYESAQSYFSLAGEYRDASTQVQRMIYTRGHAAFLDGDYETANVLFSQLEGPQTEYGHLHFETLADAASYLDQQRLNLSSLFSFHIDVNADEEFYDTLRNLFPCQIYYPNYYEPDKLLTIAGIHYYSGENILYAWRNNDTSHLTEEELQVMELAMQVIEQADAETDSPHEMERWLHDWLCNQVTYESPNMDVRRKDFIQLRELTCVGAMLDKTANCQGYADAFYLLGNMAGFEVDRVLGVTGEGHIWNTIVLDGQRYIVDVTFDDLSDEELNGWSYTYFNTFWDPEVYDPFGNDEASLPVITEPDLTQTYFSHTDRIFSNLEDAVESLVNQQVNDNSTWTYAMIENTQLTHEDLTAALKSNLRKYYRSFYWTQWLDFYGDSSYIVIYWQ